MTRKDYRLAAKNILDMPTKNPREKVMLVVFCVRTFSQYDNFDYDRFIKAAGVNQHTIDIYEEDFNPTQRAIGIDER